MGVSDREHSIDLFEWAIRQELHHIDNYLSDYDRNRKDRLAVSIDDVMYEAYLREMWEKKKCIITCLKDIEKSLAELTRLESGEVVDSG